MVVRYFQSAAPVGPAAIGIGFGLLEVGLNEVVHWTRLFLEFSNLGVLYNVPWPGSALFYPGGAVLVEVFYRLLPVPLLLWLICGLLLRGRRQSSAFWTLAVLTSFIEPTTQDLGVLQYGVSPLVAGSEWLTDFSFNFCQAALFRRYGFVAAIATRVAMYLVWHTAYGNFSCRC
jgi:hypothetical protein